MEFDKIGIMIDCSRNAVPTVATLKKIIDLSSKMGYNRLELYTEDTYEIKGRPYFGYLRGKYTCAELKEVDMYAAGKGMELTPCIQVLAHVNQIFRWPEFAKVFDCDDILLCDEPETYSLIDDMFKSLADSYTSRYVNIGCDEAHAVGLGKYLDKFGYQDRFNIINRHIGKVLEIAAKYGFKCAMWSDMYFRLAFSGDYYSGGQIPPEVRKRIPKNITLVYWDYFSTEAQHFGNMFAAHKQIGNEIAFAGGAHKWTGLSPDNAFGMRTYDVALAAAKEHKIRTVSTTAWGDDGGEASFFSILPSLYYFARLANGKSVKSEDMEKDFKRLTGAAFSDFMDIEAINAFSRLKRDKKPNAEKYFLYDDCFLGIFRSLIVGDEAAHYRAVADKLADKLKARKYGKFSYIFKTMHALAEVLELKADLGVRTYDLYKNKDKKGLKKIAADYALVIKRLDALYKIYELQWKKENKYYGFEIQSLRFGGLSRRLQSCRARLLDYCKGTIDSIPELNEEILPYAQKQEPFLLYNRHLYNASPAVPSHYL